MAHPPPLADDRVACRDAARPQVLPEPSGGKVASEVVGPTPGFAVAVHVDGLETATVVLGVALPIAGQSETSDVDGAFHRSLVDPGFGDAACAAGPDLVQYAHGVDPAGIRRVVHRPRSRSIASRPAWTASSDGTESGSIATAHGPATRAVSGAMFRLTRARAIGPSS